MADPEVHDAVEQARTGRVELGAFTREELWRAGVELSGAKPRQDPPPPSRLPLGPRAFRQLEEPPRPVLLAKLAVAGAELAHVQRDAVLVDRSVVKVVETRAHDALRTLTLEPLDGLLDEIMAEGGFTRPASTAYLMRLFLVFPLRFKWARGKGLLPSQRWFVAKAPVRKEDVIWLDLTVRTHPGEAPEVTEQRSAPAASLPDLDPAADAAALKAHVATFFETFWNVPGPGSRP